MADVVDEDADRAPDVGRLVVILTWSILGIVGLALLLDALWLDGNTMALTYVGSFFAVGVLTFLGFLYVARHVRVPAGVFEDGDVRFAITGTILTLYLLLLTFFLFSPYRHDPPLFVQAWSDNMLVITSVVIGFYFATTGVTDFMKFRLRREEMREEREERRDDRPVRGAGTRRDGRRAAVPGTAAPRRARRTRNGGGRRRPG